MTYDPSEPRDEQGRWTTERAKEMAHRLVEIHNAASVRYKAAFKAVGARMWHDDSAHALDAKSEAFIAKQMAAHSVSDVKAVYGQLSVPLTQLDSYPNAQRFRPMLRAQVSAIHAQHQALWSKALAKA